VVAGMVLDVVKAAPLPEAKPNDVGFSQRVLARLDDFFAREMAAKRGSGAVVAIARDDPLQGVRLAGFDKRYADSARCRIRTRVHDPNGGGRWADASGARPLASSGQTRGLLPGLADMKVGMPQADGSLKLGAQFSPMEVRAGHRPRR
jgi:hypothetical protein